MIFNAFKTQLYKLVCIILAYCFGYQLAMRLGYTPGIVPDISIILAFICTYLLVGTYIEYKKLHA
jgi:hypothetical protein